MLGSPITVAANKVNLIPGQEIVLRCSSSDFPDVQFEWYKKRVYPYKEQHTDETPRELVKSNDHYIINNNVMIIKLSTLDDVGDYFCKVVGGLRDGMAEEEKMISVRPRPYIMDFDLEGSTLRSAIVEDGKMLKISCNVMDDYAAPEQISLKWFMSKYEENDMNDVVSDEDGIHLFAHNTTTQDLIIDKVTKDHRRLYKCHASNGMTENSKSILIRVRDKYSAAWPAVGIIIELVILIGVICFVENRRVEPDKGAYDRKAIQM